MTVPIPIRHRCTDLGHVSLHFPYRHLEGERSSGHLMCTHIHENTVSTNEGMSKH